MARPPSAGRRALTNPDMALQRVPLRADTPTVQTVGDALERGTLQALSQRKLNALGLPLAYVDRNFRYRFANRAFLDWLGRRPEEVLGHEMAEVVGREVWTLYHAYADAALEGERAGFERQLVTAGRPPIWIRVDYSPDRSATGRGWSPTASACRSSTSTASSRFASPTSRSPTGSGSTTTTCSAMGSATCC